MIKVLAVIVSFFGLAAGEYASYQFLRTLGVPSSAAIICTLLFCLGCFFLFAAMFLLGDREQAPIPRGVREGGRSNKSRNSAREAMRPGRPSNPLMLPEYTSGNYDGHSAPSPKSSPAVMDTRPSGDGSVRTMSTASHVNSAVFKDEMLIALDQLRKQLCELIALGNKELSRFDMSVLKTLERNNPGSIEGVVTARKILSAVEARAREIDRFLTSLPITDMPWGQSLLTGDLEVPDDKLTATFKSSPIPPIKVSEVDFHLRVLLKRISRRRSIFRGSIEDITSLG